MDRNKNIIPSMAWNIKCAFEYELGLLKFVKDENTRKVVEEYLKERIKELKEKTS